MTDQSIMDAFHKQSMEIIRLKDERTELRQALEDIARNHDGHQTYSGTICAEIASKVLDRIK